MKKGKPVKKSDNSSQTSEKKSQKVTNLCKKRQKHREKVIKSDELGEKKSQKETNYQKKLKTGDKKSQTS